MRRRLPNSAIFKAVSRRAESGDVGRPLEQVGSDYAERFRRKIVDGFSAYRHVFLRASSLIQIVKVRTFETRTSRPAAGNNLPIRDVSAGAAILQGKAVFEFLSGRRNRRSYFGQMFPCLMFHPHGK